MIIDAQNQFADAQAVTADATSTNVIDLGAARNIFDGEPMGVLVTIDVAADNTTGDETYDFQLHTDDNAAMSSSTKISSIAPATASLVAGYQFVIPVPVGVSVEQYLALKLDVGGTTPSVTYSAALLPLSFIQKQKHYADNVTIS